MESGRPHDFNGVDVAAGDYLFPRRSADELAAQLVGRPGQGIDAEHLEELRVRAESARMAHFGRVPGVDVADLAQTGWAAIFPGVHPGTPEARRQDEIAEALYPLFELRRAQAARVSDRRFKIFRGAEGYRRSERKADYLARLGALPGPVDPDRVPYYLLLVASPAELPFEVQYQLDVQYSVGRLHFDDLAGFAAYARSVALAESAPHPRRRHLVLVGVNHPDDPVTRLSAEQLVTPLGTRLATAAPDWTLYHYGPEHATKASLARLFGGDLTPAILLTAGHAAGFHRGDPRQRRQQGALVTQDWPGPLQWCNALPPNFYFAADDLRPDAALHGMIHFHAGSFTAGTPAYGDPHEPIADAPFLSALHQGLLGHPNGGALATVGHLERAYACSFAGAATARLAVFEVALRRLLAGQPIGAAMEPFNAQYADLTAALHGQLRDARAGLGVRPLELADAWTGGHDARSLAILGDPAVRIPPLAPRPSPSPPEVPPGARTGTVPPSQTLAYALAPSATRPTSQLHAPTPPSHAALFAHTPTRDAAAADPPSLPTHAPQPASAPTPPPAPAPATAPSVPPTAAPSPHAAPDLAPSTPFTPNPPTSSHATPAPAASTPSAPKAVTSTPSAPAPSPPASAPSAPNLAAPASPAPADPATLTPAARLTAPFEALLSGVSHAFAPSTPLDPATTPSPSPATGEPPNLDVLVHRFVRTLERTLADLGTLEVKTYTSRDLAAAATTPPDAPVAAELRAFSRIRLDGDIEICVPTDHGEPDRALWQLHVDMVKQAQAHRAELMQMLLTTAARLARGG